MIIIKFGLCMSFTITENGEREKNKMTNRLSIDNKRQIRRSETEYDIIQERSLEASGVASTDLRVSDTTKSIQALSAMRLVEELCLIHSNK